MLHATVILVNLWRRPPILSGHDLLPRPHLSVVRRHHRCRQLLPPILFVMIIIGEHVHAGGACCCCCCCCCIAYAWISQVAHAREELRWLHTIYCHYLIIYLFCSSSVSCFFFFLCFFLLLLLLRVGCHFWQESSLPFLAGEVECPFLAGGRLPFRQVFFHVVVILHAYVRVAVAEFFCVWSVADLTKDESPHIGYTFTPWVVSFTPLSIEHQVGGTSSEGQ